MCDVVNIKPSTFFPGIEFTLHWSGFEIHLDGETSPQRAGQHPSHCYSHHLELWRLCYIYGQCKLELWRLCYICGQWKLQLMRLCYSYGQRILQLWRFCYIYEQQKLQLWKLCYFHEKWKLQLWRLCYIYEQWKLQLWRMHKRKFLTIKTNPLPLFFTNIICKLKQLKNKVFYSMTADSETMPQHHFSNA